MGALLAGGAVTMPVGPAGSGRILLGTVVAAAVDEGDAKPVMAVDFDLSSAPEKVEGQIVVTAEAARSFDLAVQSGIRQHLVSAAAAAVNTRLVASFIAPAPQASADVGVLLAAVSNGAPKRPAIIGGFAELLALDAGQLRDLDLLGVAVLPCAEAAGYVIAVDLSGLLLADSGSLVETAKHATLALDSAPEDAPVFNLWQRNCVAIRAERWINVSFRPDAVAHGIVGPA